MKSKKILFTLITTLVFLTPFHSVLAEPLPDLVLSQFRITRLEWRQMPDCDHNACQNLIWKALLEYTFMVENRGLAPAQIPNGSFESSAIEDTLLLKNNNIQVSQILNWESAPNSIAPGARVQLVGKMYVEDNPALLKLYQPYLMCLRITDRPSDPQQNWNLVESNTDNNTLCSEFILKLPTHINPNPTILHMDVPPIIHRNADQSIDFQVLYIVQNTVDQVYVSNFGRHIEVIGNGVNTTFCAGNIAPGLHGKEMKTIGCTIHIPRGAQRGPYTIRAVVDSAQRIVESNEQDNILEKQIQIL